MIGLFPFSGTRAKIVTALIFISISCFTVSVCSNTVPLTKILLILSKATSFFSARRTGPTTSNSMTEFIAAGRRSNSRPSYQPLNTNRVGLLAR